MAKTYTVKPVVPVSATVTRVSAIVPRDGELIEVPLPESAVNDGVLKVKSDGALAGVAVRFVET